MNKVKFTSYLRGCCNCQALLIFFTRIQMLPWTWHVTSGCFKPDWFFIALNRQPFKIDLSFAFTAFYTFLGAQNYSARGEELFAPHTYEILWWCISPVRYCVALNVAKSVSILWNCFMVHQTHPQKRLLFDRNGAWVTMTRRDILGLLYLTFK